MNLLKNDKIEKKVETNNTRFTIKDGWHFGIGFGLAMTIAVPLILLWLSCVVGTILLFFGSSLGALGALF